MHIGLYHCWVAAKWWMNSSCIKQIDNSLFATRFRSCSTFSCIGYFIYRWYFVDLRCVSKILYWLCDYLKIKNHVKPCMQCYAYHFWVAVKCWTTSGLRIIQVCKWTIRRVLTRFRSCLALKKTTIFEIRCLGYHRSLENGRYDEIVARVTLSPSYDCPSFISPFWPNAQKYTLVIGYAYRG
jgi:hypothetical protein